MFISFKSLSNTHQLKVLESSISKNHLWGLDIKFKAQSFKHASHLSIPRYLLPSFPFLSFLYFFLSFFRQSLLQIRNSSHKLGQVNSEHQRSSCLNLQLDFKKDTDSGRPIWTLSLVWILSRYWTSDPLAFTSQMLRLEVCSTTAGSWWCQGSRPRFHAH